MQGTTAAAGAGSSPESPAAAASSGSAGFCLDEFLPYRLSRLAARVSRALAVVYAERFALSIAQWRTVATLQAEPGLTARDVAARAALDKVAVSRAVAALEERGLLRRQPVSGDRRASCLRLSRRGNALFRRIAPLALDREDELLAPLSPGERREFRRLLCKLEAGVPAAGPRRSSGQGEVSP